MKNEKRIQALILEKDGTVAASVQEMLQHRQYAVTLSSKKEDARLLFEEGPFHLAVVGDAEDSDSPFHIMKDIVTISPMTSMILITDVSKEEVEEMAEGYGILGHVNRTVKPDELILLLESFEHILQSF